MDQHLHQVNYSAFVGVRGGAHFMPPQGPDPAFLPVECVLGLPSAPVPAYYYAPPPHNSGNMINMRYPIYQDQSNYQGFRPVAPETYFDGFNCYYYDRQSNSYPGIYAMPLTGGHSMYQQHLYVQEINDIRHIESYLRGRTIQEDETLIMEEFDHEADCGLLEEEITKHLKTRNFDGVRDTNEEAEPEICTVCQHDLCQEDQMIGVLDCDHQYHAQCIKKWLQMKNVCPLCKAIALPVDDDQRGQRIQIG